MFKPSFKHAVLASVAGLALAACGGSGGSDGSPTGPIVQPPPPPAPVMTGLDTKSEAATFLLQAGLGASDAETDAAMDKDASAWVTQQLAMPPVLYRRKLEAFLPEVDARNYHNTGLVWQEMFTADAQLRVRMNFALSQLFVINDRDHFRRGYDMAEWMDLLDRNAFGNFRDLLGEVTTSPVMGRFLTYLYNQKGDERTGRKPDENYAREILQLFSIGLVELNMDGTVKTDANGEPIETFTNEDIVGLARVFTGYAFEGSSYNYNDRVADHFRVPMRMYDQFHSPLEKSFLGTTIPAGTPGEQSVETALDTIFAHPNVAPFISRQLIQRFTASNPSPAYVRRVSEAFETGSFTAPDGTRFGTGERGDLAATISAVLLDPSVHDGVLEPGEGKVREPVLKLAQFVRTYSGEPEKQAMIDRYNSLTDASGPLEGLAQSPLKSPSVFNFYRPAYIAPSTETGEAGYTAPELQIVNATSALGYAKFMSGFVTKRTSRGDGIGIPDYDEEVAIADDAAALVDSIDLKLLAGRMRGETRAAMVETLELLPVRMGSNHEEDDRRARIRIAMLMALTSPEYAVLD